MERKWLRQSERARARRQQRGVARARRIIERCMIKWKTTMFVDVRRSDCVFFLYFVTFNFVIFDIEHKWKHAQNEQKRTNKKNSREVNRIYFIGIII